LARLRLVREVGKGIGDLWQKSWPTHAVISRSLFVVCVSATAAATRSVAVRLTAFD
jgi:hypothetical protein